MSTIFFYRFSLTHVLSVCPLHNGLILTASLAFSNVSQLCLTWASLHHRYLLP